MTQKKTKPDWYQIRSQGDATPEVWIYGVIGDWWDETDATSFAENFKALGNDGDVLVRIHSMGGSVTDGLAIYNIIKSSGLNVTTQIDGVAASMASVIALAGDVRRASKDVVVMIHNASGGARGTADELRKAADAVEIHNDVLVGIYAERTALDEDTVRVLMDDETYMTGSTALEHGFLTALIEEQQLAACGDSGVLAQLASMQDRPNLTKHLTASGLLPDAQLPRETPMEPKKKTAGQPEDQLDAAAIAAKAQADEKTRQKGIRAEFDELDGDFTALMNEAIDNEDTLEEVQARVKWLKAAGKGSEPAAGDPIEIGADARDKFKKGALNHLLAQAGLEDADPQNNFRGYTAAELARECLVQANARPSSSSRMEVVASAFTHSSSDFPFLLQECARRALLKGFEETDETFQLWTQKGSMSDFRAHDRGGLGGFGSLAKIPEGGEYKHFSLDEYKETNQLATYGRMFSITRQAIINDDLRAFTTVPQKMGRSARRTIGDLVYALLAANPKMGDGVELFHAKHGNLGGSAAQITTAAVQAIRAKMAKQKGRDKNVTALNIRPNVLLCPVEMEGTAKTVATAEHLVGGDAGDLTPNIVRNTFEVISDARMAEDAWYMLAKMFDTLEVAYLDGNETPHLEQQQGWNIDGTEFKVRLDAGIAPMEFASMYKQPAA